MFLQDFNYTLAHIPGHQNTVADLLSWRSDLNKEVNTNEPRILLPDTLFSEPQHDSLHKTFLEDNAEHQRSILQQIHDSPIDGHPGIANTWELVKQSYEGPWLREFVEEYLKGCAKCQESKMNLPRSKASLQRFDTHVEDGPFQYLSMDLITDLPKSEGYNSILTIVDQGCSKVAKFISCMKTIDGPGVAKEYLHHLVSWFGLPQQIISDRDPRFTSNFSHIICKDTGIQQNLSTAFHPWTDRQTEQMNAWVEQYLRPWTSNRPHDWAQLLPMAEFAHNSWKHNVAQKSPHELLMGTYPQVNIQLIKENIPAMINRLQELTEARQSAQEWLQMIQKAKDNKTPRNPRGKMTERLKKGNQVWLEGKNLSIKGKRKLMPKRYGPFTITEEVTPVAFRLDLPESMKVHDVFHINLLSPYKETEAYGTPFAWPPPIIDKSEEEYEIDAILDVKKQKGTSGKCHICLTCLKCD
jgi:Integrase zinc binding domain